MTAKMILIHGIPGSGKSTLREKYIAEHPEENVVTVSRDDIRTNLFGNEYHNGAPDPKSEARVSFVANSITERGLAGNNTVIVDKTNIVPRDIMESVKMARAAGAEIHQIKVDTPVEECKRRNAARGAAGGRRVPDEVIDRMAEHAYGSDGHLKDFIIGEKHVFRVEVETPGMRALAEFNSRAEKLNPMNEDGATVLVDVDGTLAANNFEQNRAFGTGKKDFNYFNRSIKNSAPNEAVVALANQMRDQDNLNVVVLTGRDDSCAKELISFVERSGLKVSRIVMKREGDGRPDREFKPEALDRLRSEGMTLVHSIDDRPGSVAAYEAAGVPVSRVRFHEPVHPSSAPATYDEPEVMSAYGTGVCLRCGNAVEDGLRIHPLCRVVPVAPSKLIGDGREALERRFFGSTDVDAKPRVVSMPPGMKQTNTDPLVASKKDTATSKKPDPAEDLSDSASGSSDDAPQWHFNPSTGKTSRCSARVRGCPLKMPSMAHSSTQEGARRAFESFMESRDKLFPKISSD